MKYDQIVLIRNEIVIKWNMKYDLHPKYIKYDI